MTQMIRLEEIKNPLKPCTALSDRDLEVLFYTVDILPVHEGVVGGLVVDQLAGVGRGPVLVPVDRECPRPSCSKQSIICLQLQTVCSASGRHVAYLH